MENQLYWNHFISIYVSTREKVRYLRKYVMLKSSLWMRIRVTVMTLWVYISVEYYERRFHLSGLKSFQVLADHTLVQIRAEIFTVDMNFCRRNVENSICYYIYITFIGHLHDGENSKNHKIRACSYTNFMFKLSV